MIYRYEISIVDISTLLKNINIDIDIDKDNLENIDIDIDIDKSILENIDIDKDNLRNIVIDIDSDKDYLENIVIDKKLSKIWISISISIRTFWVKKSFFSADLTLFSCFFDEISRSTIDISAFFGIWIKY